MAVESEITLNGQEPGVEFEYRVIAVNKTGDGPASNIARAVLWPRRRRSRRERARGQPFTLQPPARALCEGAQQVPPSIHPQLEPHQPSGSGQSTLIVQRHVCGVVHRHTRLEVA